jgi:hypothetical protein
MNAEAPSGWSAHDVAGTVTTYGASDGVKNLWNHPAGPVTNGELTDNDPVDPAPDPEEVVEPPPPSDSAPPVEETEDEDVDAELPGGDASSGGSESPPAEDGQPRDPVEDEEPSGGSPGQTPPVVEPDTAQGPELLFSRAGDMFFDGKNSSVIELAPSDALMTESATISFNFNADSVAGRQGLLTKDAKGYEINEGHYAAYIEKGKLLVRFQEGAESEVFSYGGIKTGTDYSVRSSFGQGKVEVWVNNESLGSRNFDMSWVHNDEYLQIGGNGWGSVSGQPGFRDPFKGTISDVSISGRAPTSLNDASYETATFAFTKEDGAGGEGPASSLAAERVIADLPPETAAEETSAKQEANLLKAMETDEDSPRGLFPKLLELLREAFGLSDDEASKNEAVPAAHPEIARDTTEPFDLRDIIPSTGHWSDNLPPELSEDEDRLLFDEFA